MGVYSSKLKRAMAVGMGVTAGIAPIMMNVNTINANGVERGTAVNLGQQYTMTWTSADNGKVKDYDMTISGNKLVVKLQQMKFQSGEELNWDIKLLNSAGQLVSTQKASDCAVSNNERVATFNNLSAGKYTVRLDPSLHIYDGSVQVGVSFSTDGNGGTVETASDWKNHWAKDGIQEAMDKGWVVKDDTFRPNDPITRAEVVKIINKAYEFTKIGDEPFTDVNKGDWYYDEVRIALAKGVISKDTNFRPNDKITRQEFAVMVSNIETGKVGDPNHDKFAQYKDYNQAGDWAKNSIEYTIERGYMGAGGEYFNPANNITRAEAVTTLTRIK